MAPEISRTWERETLKCSANNFVIASFARLSIGGSLTETVYHSSFSGTSLNGGGMILFSFAFGFALTKTFIFIYYFSSKPCKVIFDYSIISKSMYLGCLKRRGQPYKSRLASTISASLGFMVRGLILTTLSNPSESIVEASS